MNRGGERINLEEYILKSTDMTLEQAREWLADIERDAWRELGSRKRGGRVDW